MWGLQGGRGPGIMTHLYSAPSQETLLSVESAIPPALYTRACKHTQDVGIAGAST